MSQSQRMSVSATGEKRKRDPTFTASEKMTLTELVENHFNIVESKKTDAVSMKKKLEEWHKIEIEFNAISSIYPRDWNVLKNCWENLKKRAKQAQTQRNQHHLGTGGGPPKKFHEDPVIERVLALIKSRVSGYLNVYDSDSTSIIAADNFGATPESSLSQTLIISDNIETITHNTETAPTETVDWSQYTPSMIRNARNPALLPHSSPHFNDVECAEQQLPTPLDTYDQSVMTPRNQNRAPGAASTSRRRPALRRNREDQSLTIMRMKTLELANTHAQEEHNMNMKILKLKEEQEMLKLKILEIELKKLQE